MALISTPFYKVVLCFEGNSQAINGDWTYRAVRSKNMSALSQRRATQGEGLEPLSLSKQGAETLSRLHGKVIGGRV